MIKNAFKNRTKFKSLTIPKLVWRERLPGGWGKTLTVIDGKNTGSISGGAGSNSSTGNGGAVQPGPTTTNGNSGLNANATVKPNTPPVSVPMENLINGAVTQSDRDQVTVDVANGITTKIDVTLTVEKKDAPADKGTVDSVVSAGQTVGVYLEIVLTKDAAER